MKVISNWISVFLSFIFLLGISDCTKKEPVFDVCNCQGTKIEDIKNEGGVIAFSADSTKIISVNHGYITTCLNLPQDFQIDGARVLFSGRMILTCKKQHGGYAVWSTYLDLSNISKIDTLYVNENPQIRIVKTEDYGLAPGFGYLLNDTRINFKIQQFEVPAVGGQSPFKKYNDALKIAFLTAYKLENSNDFPTIYLGDLSFLRIIPGI